MIYGSVCSGIEAASVAWNPLIWEASFFSEIEKFPSAVLAHHYPDVPNRGDMTKFKEWPDAKLDVLVGGTPCQSFSIAGLRKGLDDPRGNLMLTYLAIAARYRPEWLVWENVPGVLSSNGGKDFGTFLGGLGELGYGFAYRVLDAQYCGVPQRRRRVFVVGCLGDWRRAAAVLFEHHSLSGNPAPSRQKGQDVAGTFKACAGSGGWSNSADHAAAGFMLPVASTGDTAHSLNAGGMGRQDYETETLIAHSLRGEGFDASEDGTGRGHANSHQNGGGHQAVCFDMRGREGGAQLEGPHDTANIRAANGGSSRSYISSSIQVRRLTPRECERLQGFPDDYCLIPYGRPSKAKLDTDFLKYQLRGNPKHLTREDIDRLAKDGPRYKALGNSMAVPVMRWIGERIDAVNSIAVMPKMEVA